MQQRNLRTFYIILLTQTFSMIGSRISALAIGFSIFADTGEATPLTLVAFFAVLPMLLASNISGLLADRWDRRYVMIIADLGQALGTLLLLVSFASGEFQLWHLYAVTLLQSIFSVFQGPAFQASVTMLVPEDQRDRANVIQQLTGPAAGIVAPAIAGLIYAAVGVVGSIMIDLGTFLAAVVVILFVHIPRPEQTAEGQATKGSLWAEVSGGFRYLWARKPLFALTLQIAVVNFFISGAMTLATPYILSRTGSETALGGLLSVMNIGGLIGGIIIGVWGGTRPRIHSIMLGIIFSGIALIGFGAAQTIPTLGVALFLIMFPLPMVNALMVSVIQLKVPPDVQGRVFAVLGQLSLLLTPIAYVISGPLADRVFEPAVRQAGWQQVAPLVGSQAGAGMGLIFFIAGVFMAGTTAAVYALPAIRRMEATLPDYKPADEPAIPVEAGVMSTDAA